MIDTGAKWALILAVALVGLFLRWLNHNAPPHKCDHGDAACTEENLCGECRADRFAA